MMPFVLQEKADEIGITNFRRVRVRTCIHCDHFYPSFGNFSWKCQKHDLEFGDDERNVIAIAAEFVCDDWEGDVEGDFPISK